MKKLLLIIATLILVSCSDAETRQNDCGWYADDVTVLNENGDVIRVYNNVMATYSGPRVEIRTRDGERFTIIGGIIITKEGN